ncbi:Uroporphyrin-III C-methyltransferase (fragment) [Frankia canadensis]|uniref:Uroporphyrin-III C-methyltransferase n=1 Tax=Frankia canadensis TaxID=1836972 RepID=A0A2I2KYS0_9ACTN
MRALAGLTLIAARPDVATSLDAVGLASVPLNPARPPDQGLSIGAPVLVAGAAEVPMGGPWTLRRIRLLMDETADADPRIAEELRHGDFDVAAFASSTAARSTAELYGPLPPDLLVAAMGRRSAEACEAAGMRVDIVPAEPGVHPLAGAVADFITATRVALQEPGS